MLPEIPHVFSFPVLYTALSVMQPLVKDRLLKGKVQVSLRHGGLILAPVTCLGALLHELDARGERRELFTFSLKRNILYSIKK